MTPVKVTMLLSLVLLAGLLVGYSLSRYSPVAKLLFTFVFAWAIVVMSFMPGCELNALKMEGGATGERCTYSFGELPNKPPMPAVHDTKPCPDGDVCFTKDMFAKLINGIGQLEGDSADLRRRWTLEVQAYDSECYEH